ncbi:TetR/AcrR family transcriptional regulator [Lichenihabitans psoromatis]|uniref:TetR/AcrR family transcriptional regulator n=1 Tax=Lichenihabitans psoromatis TaxID=2528642 RepID=UPI0010362983|nr:TetR/AcrR family transcriptional regulator [Lichenihabitans psoromatis]
MTRIPKTAPRAITARGAATKTRIIEAAAGLVYRSGAGRLNLDDVMEASGTSKSQIYHYFPDKDALVREVIALQTRRILQANADLLDELGSFDALRAWRDMLVAANRAGDDFGGCPIGSLASELAGGSEQARTLLCECFEAWSAIIGRGLFLMQGRGLLSPSADVAAAATAMLAAIQGGILFSKTARSSKPLELAFDMAIGHVERLAS